MNFLCAYFGSISCINAYKFKGLLGHKNPGHHCVQEFFLLQGDWNVAEEEM
jgi:hypothetical protein